MDPEEALELGQHAIEKISRIAIFVGQKEQRIVCGRLGGQLFILADYLQGLSDQVHQLSRVPKLLRDIERICCWPEKPKDDYCPRLRGIANTIYCTNSYRQGEADMIKGLTEITAGNGEEAEKAILHIRRSTKRAGIKKQKTEEITTSNSMPVDYLDDAKSLVYQTLRKHVRCTCDCGSEGAVKVGEHSANLLLSLPSGDLKPFVCQTCKSFPEPQEACLEMVGAEIYGRIQHIPQQASEGSEVFYRGQCYGYPPFLPPPILHAFVELYFEYFDPKFPFLHPSTVEDLEIPWILLLAIAAVGSHYSEIKEADQYTGVLCDLLARAVEVTVLEKLMKPDLATVQSVFLLRVLWMFSGSHKDKVVLQHKRNSLATMCWDPITADRRANKTLQVDPEQEWQDWLESESLLRVATCIRGLECLGHLFLGSPLILNFRDITRQMPCSNAVWQARSEKSWRKAQEIPVSEPDTKSTFIGKMTLLELFIDEKNIARQFRSSQLLRSAFTNNQTTQIPDYENPQLEASIDKAASNGTETVFHVLAILKRLPLRHCTLLQDGKRVNNKCSTQNRSSEAFYRTGTKRGSVSGTQYQSSKPHALPVDWHATLLSA
ncbi:uncharacterized protein FIESC28_04157 [Fusarium coffeatum]|uniref:Xylanolytic transcriptional activator regulatory domain-containing protein n=1 Tax=Fusarium coffeatum TaxID=231269 RepID=A0A366S2B2_9HYPO|nr:uncharacterized protein FIESC28_04157 [Fusarium coffeatum]RBR23162.1 hypothetical protein FIESC28_04157 [Fusarium coffeatum]